MTIDKKCRDIGEIHHFGVLAYIGFQKIIQEGYLRSNTCLAAKGKKAHGQKMHYIQNYHIILQQFDIIIHPVQTNAITWHELLKTYITHSTANGSSRPVKPFFNSLIDLECDWVLNHQSHFHRPKKVCRSSLQQNNTGDVECHAVHVTSSTATPTRNENHPGVSPPGCV